MQCQTSSTLTRKVVTLQVQRPSSSQAELDQRTMKQEGQSFLWAIMSAQRDPVDLNKQ